MGSRARELDDEDIIHNSPAMFEMTGKPAALFSLGT